MCVTEATSAFSPPATLVLNSEGGEHQENDTLSDHRFILYILILVSSTNIWVDGLELAGAERPMHSRTQD